MKKQYKTTMELYCIFCGKKFLRKNRYARRSVPIGVRQRNSVTCSVKCSRKYTRYSRGSEKL